MFAKVVIKSIYAHSEACAERGIDVVVRPCVYVLRIRFSRFDFTLQTRAKRRRRHEHVDVADNQQPPFVRIVHLCMYVHMLRCICIHNPNQR